MIGTGKTRFPKLEPAETGRATKDKKSIAVRKAELMRTDMPNDLGLLLGTFVMPSSESLPTFIRHPVRRARMEFQRLIKRGKDLISVIMYKRSQVPSLKLHLRRTAPTAAALHRQMCTAIAEGNTPLLDNLTTLGLLNTLKTRIASRPARISYTWTLHRYLSAPRVVSHRAAMLPFEDGSGTKPGVRQAVVRIHSVQSLVRNRPDSRAPAAIGTSAVANRAAAYLAHFPPPAHVPGMGAVRSAVGAKAEAKEEDIVEREVTEYVVIQKRCYKAEEEDWRIFGTTEATKIEEWNEAINPEMPVDPSTSRSGTVAAA